MSIWYTPLHFPMNSVIFHSFINCVILLFFNFDIFNFVLSSGLEVILEEPEEDYCSSPVSHSGEDTFTRDSNLRLRLKAGERGSLDGSEGIGSAEGDSSGGGSDHYGEEEEEDCASSGIHSQGKI